jgi:hypothetical protein
MADFTNNLTSISWWIGVVIVGILLNLVAIYLKSPIDRCFIFIFSKSQTWSKAKIAEREAKIMNLVGNKQEQILFASETNFTLVTGVLRILYALFFITTGIISTVWRNLDPVMKDKLDLKIFLNIIFILVRDFYGDSGNCQFR